MELRKFMDLEWNQTMASYADTLQPTVGSGPGSHWHKFFPTSSEDGIMPWDHAVQSPASPPLTEDSGTDVGSQFPKESKLSPRSRAACCSNDKTCAGDRCKKRREQNRNAQRAYRERKEKYMQNLLKHMEEMKTSHIRLSESYKAARQEADYLQTQVDDLKAKLEFWNKAQLLVVKVPESGAAPGALDVMTVSMEGSNGGPPSQLMALQSESAYSVI